MPSPDCVWVAPPAAQKTKVPVGVVYNIVEVQHDNLF